MIEFPQGYVDEHGLDLSSAVACVNEINFSTNSNSFTTMQNGEYETNQGTLNTSVHYRADVYVNLAAKDAGKKAFAFTFNGNTHFHFSPSETSMTQTELVTACETNLLQMISSQAV